MSAPRCSIQGLERTAEATGGSAGTRCTTPSAGPGPCMVRGPPWSWPSSGLGNGTGLLGMRMSAQTGSGLQGGGM